MVKSDDDAFFSWLHQHDNEIKTVLDVGAAHGVWSRGLANFFPDAEYHLFEPRLATDEVSKALYDENTKGLNCKTVAKAVGAESGTAKFWVRGWNGVGSSLLFREGKHEEDLIDVEVTTIDDYVKEQGIETVDFLKMDIQGGELNALKGAHNTLANTTYLLLETWLISSYGEKTPHLYEIMDFLRPYKFLPLDVFGIRRNDHGTISHMDVVYMNVERTKLPVHHYRAIIDRINDDK